MFNNFHIIPESYSVADGIQCNIFALPPNITLVNSTESTSELTYVYNLFTDGEDCKTPDNKFWIPNMSYYHVNEGNSKMCTSFLCQNGVLTKREGKFYTARIDVVRH